MNALAKGTVQVFPATGTDDLIQSFLAGRKATPIQAYRRDLQQFTEFLGLDSMDTAAKHLLTFPHGHANALILAYKNHLVDKLKSQSNSVNRRLAAIKRKQNQSPNCPFSH